mgnify:CR=1 FL=1
MWRGGVWSGGTPISKNTPGVTAVTAPEHLLDEARDLTLPLRAPEHSASAPQFRMDVAVTLTAHAHQIERIEHQPLHSLKSEHRLHRYNMMNF